MPKRKAWNITAQGHSFVMIDPKGCTETQALEEAKARWPDAKIVKDRRPPGGPAESTKPGFENTGK